MNLTVWIIAALMAALWLWTIWSAHPEDRPAALKRMGKVLGAIGVIIGALYAAGFTGPLPLRVVPLFVLAWFGASALFKVE